MDAPARLVTLMAQPVQAHDVRRRVLARCGWLADHTPRWVLFELEQAAVTAAALVHALRFTALAPEPLGDLGRTVQVRILRHLAQQALDTVLRLEVVADLGFRYQFGHRTDTAAGPVGA